MTMFSDFRVGVRLFARHPAMTLAAVLSLALGIGANTAMFSVLHAVVLRPLPFPESERLMIAWETSADNPTRWVAPANFVDWRREATAFASLAAFDSFPANLTGAGEAERLRAAGASGSFFTTLGVNAALGRTLLPADDEPAAQPVVVLTDGLWQRLFGGARDAIGRTLTLDGRAHVVVGVLPSSFSMPMMSDIEIWVSGDRGIPRSFPFPGDLTQVRESHILFVIGRLREGVTRGAAQAELGSIMARLARQFPESNEGLGASVVPLHEQVVGDVRPLMLLLQIAVAVMLVIGCANVANLLLGMAAGRQSELTTRLALGAARGRLVRQLLAETLVIAVPGGLAGLALAVWALDVLVALAPAELPRTGEIRVDAAMLAFTSVVTLLAAAAFGLGPALRSARAPLNPAVQASTRLAGSRGVRRWHRVVAVGELALAQVLLVSAGLLLASFLAAQRVELGFVPEGRVAADLSLAPDRYARPRPGADEDSFDVDVEPKLQLIERVLSHLRSTPGVQYAAASFTAPMAGAPNRGIAIEGRSADGRLDAAADFQVVTPDYFRALGMTLVRGRAFEASDRSDTTPVSIVNEAFAARHYPGADPIGRVIRFGLAARHQIVGVVADARYRDVEAPADPTFYVPVAQNAERWPFLSFTAATAGDPAALAPAMREAVRAVDPNQPIARIRTYDEILRTALAPRRFNTLLVAAFAALAVLLAAVGIYGVMAYGVSSRTREIGVRTALGASPRDIARSILGEGIVVIIIALVLGLGGALAATQLLQQMLYQITPYDARTWTLVATLLAAVALTATWLPARRAVRVNPVTALRTD